MILALTYFTELSLTNLFYFLRIYTQVEIYIRQLRSFVLEMHNLANLFAINMLILLLLCLGFNFLRLLYKLLPPVVLLCSRLAHAC